MRKKILPYLKCPENGQPGLKIYGAVVMRDGQLIYDVSEAELEEEDDIISGLLISESSNTAYPIDQAIAILLAHHDVDPFHHIPLLESLKEKCPATFKDLLQKTIQRINQPSTSGDGNWNRDEMRYYDAEVETPEKRNKMLDNIRTIPVHRILLPRQWHITQIISQSVNNAVLLEIGCGNASTIYRIFNPGKHNYRYIGSDISFKRLMVAKMAIPEGDFIQASALNLPFKNEIFTAIVSFGMLHHLPRPVDAVIQVIPLIKNKGYFAFHEPIERPTVKFPGLDSLKKLMMTYEHSEHDGKINLDEVLKTLTVAGFKTIHKATQVSSLRSISETILKRINRKIMLNKQVILFIENSDKLILNTIGKLSKTVGPKAILVVMQKASG